MSAQLLSAKNLLLVVGNKLTLGDYLALHVIVDIAQSRKVRVHMCANKGTLDKYQSNLAFPEVTEIDAVKPRKFILTFNKGEGTVKNVQWKQEEGKLSFHISMENGQFVPEGLNTQMEGANYDAVLFFNVGSYEEVQKYFANFPSILQETKNFAINSQVKRENLQLTSIIAKNNSTPEIVYTNFKGQGAKAKHYTRLLAAVFDITDRFEKDANDKTFQMCAEMMSNGADLSIANGLLKARPQSTPAPAAQPTEQKSQPAPASSQPESAQTKADNSDTAN